MKITTFLITLILSATLFSQKDKAFQLYSISGKKANYKQLLKQAAAADVVLFGEYHDNPIAHWLELELLIDLYALKKDKLVLSFEMFEQDQQTVLNDYLSGKIDEKTFKSIARLWPNYETDYKPLVDFAMKKKITCVAANIERKYASLLFKKGRSALDTLSMTIKSQMADINFPVDTTLSQYQAIREMGGHQGTNMVEAQAIKDATMAKFILKGLNGKEQVYHINGAFHSDYHQGIEWYLKRSNPQLTVFTISTVTQENIENLDAENKGKADIIICVPERMTRTH